MPRTAPIVAALCTLAAFVTFVPAARAHDWNGLVRDSAGAFFVVDAEDGYVWKVVADAPKETAKARGFVTGEAGIALEHPHHLAIDEQDRLWLASGCSKNRIWRISPDGAIEELAWSAPTGLVLEAVAPDGRGGLWIVATKQTLWLASVGRDAGAPRKIADVGSESGALAVAADGALYLGDGPNLWKLAAPAPAGPGAALAHAEPELIADGLGDVYGVALAGDGGLLVSDWAGGRILALAPTPGEPVRGLTKSVLASGLEFPSGLLALADGAVLVKESGRQKNVAPRLRRIERDGTMKVWIELRRDETR